MRFCIVYGNSEDDVKHLFCFPRSADRSQIWQEAMGMKYRPLCGHVRICNEHFTKDRFVPCTSVLRLKADAVPTILEVQKDHVMKGLDQIANKKVNIISQYIIKPEPQFSWNPYDLMLLVLIQSVFVMKRCGIALLLL
ncbi:uncharacterized protein LOC130447369 isoform X2 [Diorhabda sublineata]|uniref:uncharacterized protein LOC130447369 isoform X2 n=1 Tax=Diorhabda sublineata TaxID=1163346 RepID=UPI0024E13E23|nr:uncharacterized protein LOC130447369 isoform X2 [Diorhabda sublineata]